MSKSAASALHLNDDAAAHARSVTVKSPKREGDSLAGWQEEDSCLNRIVKDGLLHSPPASERAFSAQSNVVDVTKNLNI